MIFVVALTRDLAMTTMLPAAPINTELAQHFCNDL
jgi:hypothetical protein